MRDINRRDGIAKLASGRNILDKRGRRRQRMMHMESFNRGAANNTINKINLLTSNDRENWRIMTMNVCSSWCQLKIKHSFFRMLFLLEWSFSILQNIVWGIWMYWSLLHYWIKYENNFMKLTDAITSKFLLHYLHRVIGHTKDSRLVSGSPVSCTLIPKCCQCPVFTSIYSHTKVSLMSCIPSMYSIPRCNKCPVSISMCFHTKVSSMPCIHFHVLSYQGVINVLYPPPWSLIPKCYQCPVSTSTLAALSSSNEALHHYYFQITVTLNMGKVLEFLHHDAAF